MEWIGVDKEMIVGTIVTSIYFVILIAMFGLGIYAFVLFIKLANRGIQALDIYIDEKTNRK